MQKITMAIFISVLAAISLKWLPYSFVWMFGCASLVSFLQIRNGRKSRGVIWFNIGSIFLILAVFEITLEATDRRIKSHQLYDYLEHPVLGYVLKPNSKRRAWKSHNDEMIYDVIYTVDQNGLRISPPCSGTCESSILFFGGSFTYGEGVNDQETMPYQVGLRSHSQYEVYNFGVHGYGPQNMLALIESGKVSSTVDQTPDFAIYQALYPQHVYRVAGLRSWVRTGPRYVLDSRGNAVLSGRFSDDDLNLSFWPHIRSQITKSALGRRILNYNRQIGSNDDDLFVAVVVRTAEHLKQLNPRIDIHILLWGDPPVTVVSRLEGANISVHSVHKIFQASNIPDNALRIGLDGHPTPVAHSLVADHVVRRILKLEKRPHNEMHSISDRRVTPIGNE